jgi:hypothetical protein
MYVSEKQTPLHAGMVYLIAERDYYLRNRNVNSSTNASNATTNPMGYTKTMVTLFWGFFDPQRPGDASTSLLGIYTIRQTLVKIVSYGTRCRSAQSTNIGLTLIFVLCVVRQNHPTVGL